jgi:hypothetical protein
MLGFGERMKRSFDFVARRSGVILRPRRQLRSAGSSKGGKQNESEKDDLRRY